jgi:hypothetical protein
MKRKETGALDLVLVGDLDYIFLPLYLWAITQASVPLSMYLMFYRTRSFLGIDRRIILRWIFGKEVVKCPVPGFYDGGDEPLGFVRTVT